VKAIGVLLMPGAQPLEVVGPYEVFCVADHLARQPDWGGAPAFRPVLVGARPGPVECRYGLVLQAQAGIGDGTLFDAIVVPGGAIAQSLEDADLHRWIERHARADSAPVVASVCYGAFMLASAGVLDGHAATTHWEVVADLRRRHPEVAVQEVQRVVDEGLIVTAAGNTAGLDLALRLVARWHSEALATRTAMQLEYTPPRAHTQGP
jgi:transcriptional regulator GlxA family with amidase domain